MATLREEISCHIGVVPKTARFVVLRALTGTHFDEKKVAKLQELGLLEGGEGVRLPLTASAETQKRSVIGYGYAQNQTYIWIKVAEGNWEARIPVSGAPTRTMTSFGVSSTRCPCELLVNDEECANIIEFLSRNSRFL